MPSPAFPVFDVVIFVAEQCHYVLAAEVILLFSLWHTKSKIKWLVLSAPWIIFFSLVGLVVYDSNQLAKAEGFDMTLPSMRVALDRYINTGEGDMNDIIEGQKYPPTFGFPELSRYFKSQLGGSIFHDTSQDASFLPEAYNKGDDWFEATLGEPMVYTGAIYAGPNETMWSSQLNKLEFIAHAIGVKPGDRGLDIGAGWGRLANHLASKGANMTGVVMASDQQNYGMTLNRKLKQENVSIILKNFFDLDEPPKAFNFISAVEMAEHVGIRNYNKFLRKVHELLADDGTFYIQVAGLPRGYGDHYKGFNHYEDLIWGLFMDEHVFPGADASCPMGWVLTHLERAGFEPQNVYNLGNHYSKTLYHWQMTWEAKKDSIVATYGERSWRRWRVFLAWSVRTARRGGSTVQFITATKAGHTGARIAAQDRLAPGVFKLPPHTPKGPGGGPERLY
jgi:cyclopropane fatty-acyl-phospholipid synthase-like methyltransferase